MLWSTRQAWSWEQAPLPVQFLDEVRRLSRLRRMGRGGRPDDGPGHDPRRPGAARGRGPVAGSAGASPSRRDPRRPGGANFAFLEGSVQFLKDSIDTLPADPATGRPLGVTWDFL